MISEVNIFCEDHDYEINIQGYTIIQPKSIIFLGYSRIAVLVREGVQVETMDQLMDDEIASVWLKVSGRGLKTLHIGAVYRQHKLLRQDLPNMSGEPALQNARWRKFVTQCVTAARNNDCIIMGDTNLDYNKWEQPEQEAAEMVEMVKLDLETLGFHQYVNEDTRFWSNQTSSLIDQCWTASPLRLISCRNIVRGSSDHNIIEMVVRIRGKPSHPGEIVSRSRKNMDANTFKEKIAAINWDTMYSMEDLNTANSFFESEILSILDQLAPMKVSQVRGNHKSWITKDSRDLMAARDLARRKAQQSQLPEDWLNYRQLGNCCSAKCKQDKKTHFMNLYKEHEEARDISSIYQLTKNQLGWRTGGPPSSLVVEGKVLSAPREIAEAQSKHFEKKVNDLKRNLPPTTGDPLHLLKKALNKWTNADSRPLFVLREATLIEVVRAMRSLCEIRDGEGHRTQQC